MVWFCVQFYLHPLKSDADAQKDKKLRNDSNGSDLKGPKNAVSIKTKNQIDKMLKLPSVMARIVFLILTNDLKDVWAAKLKQERQTDIYILTAPIDWNLCKISGHEWWRTIQVVCWSVCPNVKLSVPICISDEITLEYCPHFSMFIRYC